MANEILSKYGTSTAITHTIAGIADGVATYSDQVTDTSPSVQQVRIFAKVTTGTSPTANSTIEYYLSRGDDNGTEFRSGGTGTTTATFAGTKSELEFLHAIQVTGTSDKTYYPEFIVEDPGTDWNIVTYNETGAPLNSTTGNHEIRYRSVTNEVQ